MTLTQGIGKIKVLIPIAVIIIIIVAGFLVLNNFFAQPNETINETSNDLQINIDQTSSNPPNYEQPNSYDQSNSPQSTSVPQNPSNSDNSGSGNVISSTPEPSTPASSTPAPSTTNSPSYDTNHKEMIDIVSASIEKSDTTFKVTIQVNEPIEALGSQESAQFDMILILETNEDALQTYELIVNLNSTGTFYSVQDVQTHTPQTANLAIDGNKLTITTNLSELKDATQAEWSIISWYEATANNQVIYSAYDFAPDEGIKTTVFE